MIRHFSPWIILVFTGLCSCILVKSISIPTTFFQISQNEPVLTPPSAHPSRPLNCIKISNLFTSPLLVFNPEIESVKELLPEDVQPDGITGSWKTQHGFPWNDSSVSEADPDHDGYTNAEEFAFNTDPLDSLSKPPCISKLRLKKVDTLSNTFSFEGFNATDNPKKYLFQIRLNGHSLFLKQGESFALCKSDYPAQQWDIIEFHYMQSSQFKKTVQTPQPVDRSQLVIENHASHQRIVLHLHELITLAVPKIFLAERGSQAASIGPVMESQPFVFNNHFYAVSIQNPDSVLIQDVETKKSWILPKPPLN